MLLIFLNLILIWDIHPRSVKLLHPHVCEIRLPGHSDLGRQHRAHPVYPFCIGQLLQEILIQDIFPLPVIRPRHRVIFNLHVLIHKV